MGNRRGGLPKIVGGPRSWRDDIDDALLDAEPEAADPDRINAYVCDRCGGLTVTRDVHKGVTPMFLACRATAGCQGRGTSCMYSLQMLAMHLEARAAQREERAVNEDRIGALVAQGWPEPTYEWFMPTLRNVRRIARRDPAMGEHLRKGGLHLREVGT